VNKGGGLLPHQRYGIESGLFGPAVFFEGESLSSCFSQAGQSDSHLIPQSYGGTISFPIMSNGTQDLELVPVSPD